MVFRNQRRRLICGHIDHRHITDDFDNRMLTKKFVMKSPERFQTIMATSINDTTLFQSSVNRILDSWTVLKLAVEHGFGGTESGEKAEWLVFAIDQWFQENKNLETYEVEEFLADVLNREFDTVADDGSLAQIASMICGVYRLCSSGDESAVKERLSRLPKSSIQQCTKAPSDDEDVDDEDSMDTGQTNDRSSSQFTGTTSQPSMSDTLTNGTASKDDTEMEDDGWTVIRRGKRK